MKHFWIINLGLFQLSWFSSLLLTPQAWWILSLAILIHFWLSPEKNMDVKVMAVAPLGWLVDYGLFQAHWLSTGEASFPIWLLLLWCLFVLALNHSLKWLTTIHWALTALLGALFGTLSYYSAIQVGTLSTTLFDSSFFIAMAIIWALLLPGLIALRRHAIQFKTAGVQ